MSTNDSLHKSPTSILIVLLTVFTIFLTGCASGPSQAVTSADNLVKAFIKAIDARDANQYVSSFSEDGLYMDHADPQFGWTGPLKVQTMRVMIEQALNDPAFNIKTESYFISSDGASASLQGTYTNKNTKGDLKSVPYVTILQIKDRKAVRVDIYYDFTPFK